MKNFTSTLIVACVAMSACGGGPTSPTPAPRPAPAVIAPEPVPTPTPTPAPQPPPPPPGASTALTLTPNSATMSVGQTMTFTASGADGKNYAFAAGPAWVLSFELVGANAIRVKMIGNDADYAWVRVDGYDPSAGMVDRTVNITIK